MEHLLPPYARGNVLDAAAQRSALPALSGDVIDLTIADTPFRVGDRTATAKTINGTVPGPVIRLKEGQEVTLNVTNRLKERSSIHWHGLLVPPDMDGVPGVSFAGIGPGETFVYKFRLKQYGTYWYHSHSPGQEQASVYAPIIIDPMTPDPVAYDREYAVVVSDWSFQSEDAMIARLKKQAGHFNFQQRTMGEFLSDLRTYGWTPTMDNYLMWARMRMDPTDFADVSGVAYTYLMNGLPPTSNWMALFTPGERVRLRFINVGAMTLHDVRIPGLKMTVVQADGQNVQPVEVDEFRFGPAETYDVIVTPTEDRAYAIFSEVLDRSGYARGTLAPRPGMSAEIPARRPRPLRTMEDMGMSMEGMDMKMAGMKLEMDKNAKAWGKPSGMDMSMGHDRSQMKSSGGTHSMPGMRGSAQKPAMPDKPEQPGMPPMPGMDHSMKIPGSAPARHGPDSHGSGNQALPMTTRSRLDDPGVGLGGDARRVLVYTDLKALEKFYDTRDPERELEIHLTGHDRTDSP
jgi:CopA family copper-resistance protein